MITSEDLMRFRTFIQKRIPISGDDIEIFSLKARQVEFRKGELFAREGSVCNRLLFIHRGLFRYYLLHKGRDFTKDFAVDMQNPFCTAYTSFMLQKPSEIWIEALEDSLVWVWDHSDIVLLFQEHPVWQLFAKSMADHLFYRKEQREIELLKSSAEERYQRFQIDFPQLSQRVSQYHIATYLGIAPESLSRIRNRLAKGSGTKFEPYSKRAYEGY